MANSLEKVVLSLTDYPWEICNSTKAISWSDDNRAVLCCAEKLVIVNVVVGSDVSAKADPLKAHLDETINLSTIEKFSIASGLLLFKGCLAHLDEGERQQLLMDPSLTEDFIYPNEMLNTFRHAVFAPVCWKSDRPQSLIAAVTHNHRVIIFEDTSAGWNVLMDCSPLLKQHTISNMQWPVTLGKDMSLNTYTQLVHSMCTVEIEWSHVFTQDRESNGQSLLLFTGTRGGNIHVWMINYPCESRDRFILQCTDKYTSEVTALSWLPWKENEGLLSVGYLDGSLRVLKVTVTLDEATPAVQISEIFTDLLADGLSISDLSWVHHESVSALVACKQYFISLYSLCDETLRLVNHTHMDVELPLTSISVYGTSGVVSSQSGDMFTFKCEIKSGQTSLTLSEMKINCLPIGSDVQWFCLGVGLSPMSGLCLSAHRIDHRCKLLESKRTFTRRQVVALSAPFELTVDAAKEIVCSLDPFLSPQGIMINIRLYIEQLCQAHSSLQDVLLLLSELNKCDSLRALQVMRDVLQYLQLRASLKAELKKELAQVSLSYEEVSENLLVKHVGSCLQQVSSSPSLSELSVMKAMLSWISHSSSRSAKLGHNLDLTQLNSACKQCAFPPCGICGSQLNIVELLSAKCTKGHKIKLCSVSLLPCQDMWSRRCESCSEPALSLSDLLEVNFIKLKSSCTLCGGFLRQRPV